MQKVVVTSDSACDLNSEYLNKYNIALVDFYIESQPGEFVKESDITYSEIEGYLSGDNCVVRTRSASVKDYHDFFCRHVNEEQILLHFCVSSKISAAYYNACQAAVDIPNVIIIDSENISIGLGIMAVVAAREAMNGQMDIKKILSVAKDTNKRIKSSFLPWSVQYINSTNKVRCCYSFLKFIHPTFSLMNGDLKIKSIMSLRQGRLYEDFIKQEFRNAQDIDTSLVILSCVGLSAEEQQHIVDEIKKYVTFDQVYINNPSLVMSCNAAKRSCSLVYLTKERKMKKLE